jgi:hypothetical protein
MSGEVRLLIAARVGPVRLIDNLGALVGSRFGRDLQIFRTPYAGSSYTGTPYTDTFYAEQKEN